MVTRCKFRGRRGILCDVLKIDGSLARNIDFEVANFQILRKTRRKTSISKLQSVKSGGSLARNARFGAPTCLFSRVWFSRGLAVSMGEAAKLVFLSCRQLWKLPEVSHKMLVFLYPRVLSCGACVSVASPCPWGKLENLSFLNVSKQVVMLFCVADVALFDIPTCLIMCRKCHNWRKSRTKRSFFCIHVSCLCVSFSCGVVVSMGEAAKHLLFECFHAGCHVVLHGRRGTLWHSNLFDNATKMLKLDEVSHEMFVFLHLRVSFRVFGCPVASPCLWGKLQNVSFAKVSNFEYTRLLVQWGLRFVNIWQGCDYVEGGKLLCGLIQISHSVVYIFLVLCRQTFRLCSIARER